MQYEDYKAARDFIEKKALELMKHEKKDFAKVGFPAQNYMVYPIKGRTFYSVRTNTFLELIRNVLPEATEKFPGNFGTCNAFDVLKALYDTNPIFDFDAFINFLNTEQFCLVIENEGDKINDKILRIDLFRKIDANKKEFIGGIFHAFKHFSFKGVNLSTGKDMNDIAYPEKIIEYAIKAFFLEKHENGTGKNQFISRVELDEKYCLRFAFYFEPTTQVYFINTIFKEPKTT